MKLEIRTTCNLLLETANLLCAYVSGAEPAILTSADPGAIPAEALRQMMDSVCGGLNREDRKLQFFFKGHLTHQPHGKQPYLCCVASLILNSCSPVASEQLPDYRAALHASRLGRGLPYEINSISVGLGISWVEEYRSLADELRKVDLPDELRLSLVEALTAYHQHVDLLCDLLEPIALRLQPLLQPWLAGLQQITGRWAQALGSEEERLRFLRSRGSGSLTEDSTLLLQPHLLYPRLHSCTIASDDGTVIFRAGLAMRVQRSSSVELRESDVAMLQLLANTDRLRMLQAMTGRRMQSKELAHELGINRGKVFRDLNNLIQLRLVEPMFHDDCLLHTTNTQLLAEVLERVSRFINSGSQD